MKQFNLLVVLFAVLVFSAGCTKEQKQEIKAPVAVQEVKPAVVVEKAPAQEPSVQAAPQETKAVKKSGSVFKWMHNSAN